MLPNRRLYASFDKITYLITTESIIARPRTPESIERIKQAAKLFFEGSGHTAIAKKFNCKQNTIYRFSKTQIWKDEIARLTKLQKDLEKRSRKNYLEKFDKMQEKLFKLAENSVTNAEALDNLIQGAIAETYKDKQSPTDTIESISRKSVLKAMDSSASEKRTCETLYSRLLQVDYIVSEMEKQEENDDTHSN